jgi:integrase
MGAFDMAFIRIPYVKEYVDQTGAVRRYFRKRGCKSVALPGVPGSSEFMAAYQAAIGTPTERPARQGAGTVGALIVDYLSGPAFVNLKPSSQAVYRIVLDRFCTKHGHRLVRDMPRDKVAAYVHAIGTERPGMANLTRSVLRKLLAHGVRVGYRSDNPVAEIDRYKLGTRHSWSEQELAAFEKRWPPGTRERLAYALLLYTGQRGGDVVRMRRQDISGNAIAVVQEKTGTALSIPIHPKLAAAIKAGPRKGIHLIGDPNGRPIGRPALTMLMKRAAQAAGLPPECVPHGLRKAQMRAACRGRRLCQADCRDLGA